jgi:hypothetical protein
MKITLKSQTVILLSYLYAYCASIVVFVGSYLFKIMKIIKKFIDNKKSFKTDLYGTN